MDFIACNNACQLWLTGWRTPQPHATPTPTPTSAPASSVCPTTAGAPGPGPSPELLFDERYERHMEALWEPTAAKQVRARPVPQ